MFSVEEIQSLNELELAVYEYVMQHKSAISYMRIRELAAEAHVSTTTVLRFCKKMGCDGYAEFKLRMKEYSGLKKIVMLTEDMSEIRAFFERLETDKFQQKLEEAAAMIAKTERVIFVGIGSSGHVGQYAARCFTKLGKFSLYISDPFYPINIIVENGFGAIDKLEEDHTCDDSYRIDYLRRHIEEMKKAVEIDGVDLMGYTPWGCIDVVSFTTGELRKRYGFIYVDLNDDGTGTGNRYKKKSFAWYQKVVASNGEEL